MTNDELQAQDFPITWDNTMRSTGCQCARKLYWFLRGYDYKSKPAYFTWGSAFQEMLVHWYSTPHPDDEKDKLFWEVAFEAMDKGYDYYDGEQNISDQENVSKENSRENLERIWVNYLREHPSEPWSMVPGGAEAGWIWPIKGTDYFAGGSLDGYVKWEPYGMLVLETKTTAEYLSDAFISRWSFAAQVTQYVWYLTELLGTEVFGCLMNLVTKKYPGPRSKWSTPRTARSLEKRTPAQLGEFREDLLWDIEKLRSCWTNWRFPKTADPTSCSGGMGKAPCLFKNICLVDGIYFTKVDPLNYKGITLRKGPWEPWAREGGQE